MVDYVTEMATKKFCMSNMDRFKHLLLLLQIC